MPLTVDRYRVLIQTDPAAEAIEREVVVLHTDRLRAELEAPRHGLTDMTKTPMHMVTLWLWAACLREKLVPAETKFEAFKGQILNYEDVEDTSEIDGQPADPMGPTSEEALTGSPSSSSTSSPAPTGGIPTSIPA